MVKKHQVLLSIFILLFLFSCGDNNNNNNNNNKVGDYPEDAEIIQFQEVGQPNDSLKLIAEIDIFAGSEVPIGMIVGMEKIGNKLYFADSKQSLVHIIDEESLKYIAAIGGSGPDGLFRIFGLFNTGDNTLLVGNSQGPNLLKSFSSDGDFLMNFPNNDPPALPISMNINEFFISDSIAFVGKSFADKGKKIIRYDLRGGEANKIDEIVPVTDLHTKLDSATSVTIITRMPILKSNVIDSIFYAIPTNKFLINSYSMKGEKQRSVDLRGIPQINKAYSILKKLPVNSYFGSAVLDDQDNIYIHFEEFEGVEVDDSEDEMDAKIANTKARVKLLSVNLLNKTYRIFKQETRGAIPLKIIDDKLWCFDSMNSQLLVYQFPNK